MSQNLKNSKGKKKDKLDKGNEKQREVLEKKVRKRVGFEEKAFRIVERLIENTVTADVLLQAVSYIDQTHYDDIVEERTISTQCGYPICPNDLKDVPKQIYRISTKTNKVYDITDRKKFCSNQCYKASSYLKNQISTSPVWLREEEPTPHIELLHERHNKGSAGDAVTTNPKTQLRDEIDDIPQGRRQDCVTLENLADDMCKLHMNRDSQGEAEEQTYAVVDEDGIVTEVRASEVGQSTSDIKSSNLNVNQSASENRSANCDTGQVSGNGNNDNTTDLPPLFIDTDMGQDNFDLVKDTSAQTSCDTASPCQAPNREEEVMKMVEERIAMKKEALNPTPRLVEKPYAGVETVDRMAEVKDNKSDVLMELLNKRENLLKQLSDMESREQPRTGDSDGKPNIPENIVVKERHVDHFESGRALSVDSNSQSLPLNLNTKNDGNVHGDTTITQSVPQPTTSSKSSRYLANIQRAKQQKKHLEASQKDGETTKQKSSKKKREKSDSAVNAFESLQKIFLDWKTEETVRYLTGASNKTKEEVEKEDFRRKYAELGRQIDRQMGEVSDVIGEVDPNEEDSTGPGRKLPDYNKLKQETENYELKVQEYFKGNMTIPADVIREKMDTSSVRLPPVDSVSQGTIRRKIVLEKVNNKVPDLLQPLRMMVSDVSRELRELVYTFRFSSSNIVLRPVQWTLVTYILLKLLCKKIPSLKAAFEDTYSTHYLNSMLLSIGITESNVNSLVDDITNDEIAK